jgi:ferric-chelate reductase
MLKPELEVCGSDSMVHSTRSALGMGISGPTAIMKGGASVSLFVESFGYT